MAENWSLCEHSFLLYHWNSHCTSIVFSSSLKWERTLDWFSLGINSTNPNPLSCYWIHQLEKRGDRNRVNRYVFVSNPLFDFREIGLVFLSTYL